MTSLHGNIRKHHPANGHKFVTDHNTDNISHTKAIMGRYTLSEKTWVDIWPSKYGEGSYLKFIRNEQNRNGTFGLQQRWFNLSSKGWKALTVLFGEVYASICNKRWKDTQTMNLSKKERLFIPYWFNRDSCHFCIGFYYVDEKGIRVKGSGINLTKQEYKCLIEYASHISTDLCRTVPDLPIPEVPHSVSYPLSNKTYAFAVKGQYDPYLNQIFLCKYQIKQISIE
jgi:hypothetical protein